MSRLAVQWAFLATALVPGPLLARTDDTPPEITATLVQAAPRIDGTLDDTVWQGAPAVEGFRQKEPLAGAPVSEVTRVRLIYNRTHLFIAAELHDRAPSLIRAAELRRDDPLASDDSFALLLDSYHDHRNAFLFRVNPRATRYDGIVRNESRTVDAAWDEDWQAAAALTDWGWSVEIAIPFKVLRFHTSDSQTWGINFERVIKRKNETASWAAWDRNYAFTHASQAGHVNGLREIRQGERVRLRPYFAAGVDELSAAAPPRTPRGFGRVGIDDLKLALTPNLTADFTLNPDFAQAEADAQRVNLTRFSLFFPERRQFFIEGADSLKMGVDMMGFGARLLELVYTRTIGLSPDGEPIPLVGGGKLTGKVAGIDLAALNVQSEAVDPMLPSENFSVARIRKELLGRSYVGALITNRQGGGVTNRVAGADARFVLRDHLSLTSLLAAAMDDRLSDTRWAVQHGAQWQSDLLDIAANYVEIDPGFNPGVGYVRRNDRMLAGRFSFKPRPRAGPVRQLEFTTSAVYHDDRHDPSQSGEATLAFAMDFYSGERVFAKIDNEVERLGDSFEIHPAVVLRPGRYEYNRVEASLQTFDGRKLSGRAEANLGGFYTGTQGSYEFGLKYRPGKNVSFECDYELNDVELPEGSFALHLLGLKSNVAFTPRLLSSAYVQYNSAGQLAALQVRLNYIFRTIDNLYLVYNQTRFTEGVFADLSNRSLIAKMTYSLQR